MDPSGFGRCRITRATLPARAKVFVMDANQLPRYRKVVRGPFGYVLAAHTVSTLGDVAAVVALVVLIFERTRSPLLSSLTFTISFVPYLFGGAATVRLVDRLPPRATLCCLHVASAVLIAVMAIHGLPLVFLLADLVVVSFLAPAFEGVRAAILPRLLDGPFYTMGRSLLRSVSQAAQVLGYGLGGILVVAVHPQGALLIDAMTFALSAVLVLRVAVPPPTRSEEFNRPANEPRQRMSDGMKRTLLFGWLVPTCAIAPEALAAPYVSMMHWSNHEVGLLLAATPIGATLADLVCARWMPSRRQRVMLVPLAFLTCGPIAFLILRPTSWVTLGLLAVAGIGFAYNLGFDQLLISSTSVRSQTRILATYSTGLMAAQGLGFALWGALAEIAKPSVVIFVAALLGWIAIFATRPATGTQIVALPTVDVPPQPNLRRVND